MAQEIGRRAFLKTTAILGAGIAGGSALAGCSSKAPAGGVEKWDKTADVVVVGGGGSGLAAAVEASAAGASVLVLEKGTVVGGSTGLSGGMIMAAGTQLQKDLSPSQNDTVERFLEASLSFGGTAVEEDLVKDMCLASPDHIDWMTQLGRKFTLVTPMPPVHNWDEPWDFRVHWGGDGAGEHIAVLLAAAEKHGTVIEKGIEVTRLIKDEINGVIGVEAKSGSGTIHVRANRAVILATASVDWNMDMAARYCPQQYWAMNQPEGIVNKQYRAVETNTGDGIRMAIEVGADLNTQSMQSCVMSSYALAMWPGGLSGGKLLESADGGYQPSTANGVILVDPSGVRFQDELLCWPTVTKQAFLKAERNGTVRNFDTFYGIADATGVDTLCANGAVSKEEMVSAGALVEAQTIAELEAKTGLPAGALVRTVARWNENCSAGVDVDYGRIYELVPLTQAPFYATKATILIMGTGGGVRINTDAQALDTRGEPIPRLYAAGMVSAGWIGPAYHGCGWAILGTVHWGRKAGVNSAAMEAWA